MRKEENNTKSMRALDLLFWNRAKQTMRPTPNTIPRKNPMKKPMFVWNRFYSVDSFERNFFCWRENVGSCDWKKGRKPRDRGEGARENNRILIRKLMLTLKHLLCHRVSSNFIIGKLWIFKYSFLQVSILMLFPPQ